MDSLKVNLTKGTGYYKEHTADLREGTAITFPGLLFDGTGHTTRENFDEIAEKQRKQLLEAAEKRKSQTS